jgi:hypothetical protein
MIALALLGGTTAQAQDPGPKPEPQDTLGQLLGQFQPGEYWLGVAVVPPNVALRAQLGLSEADGGLVIENLVPDGPAAKAGIRQFDVLLKAGGTPLREIGDLAGQIEKSKESKMPVDLIRGGKRQTVAVTPAKRPVESLAKIEEGARPEGETGRARRLLEELLPGHSGLERWELHFLHPGQILPPGAPLARGAAKDVHVTVKTAATLPDGYKVEIVREDHKPAKISVTRNEGDKETWKWEGSEAELGKLPEKIRPEVERLVHRNPMWLDIMVAPEVGSAVGNGVAPEVRPLLPEPRLEKRLSEMSRQIEELRKKIDRLQAPPAKPAEKPEKKSPEGRRI